jgi:hypothetical protein
LLIEKDLGRVLEPERFPRSIVKPAHYEIKVREVDATEVRTFGPVLAHQTVGVLTETTFPRAVGMGKREVSLEFAGDAFMGGKLAAVVRGDSQRPYYRSLTFSH